MGKWASAGSYARTMRMRPVPFRRRRAPYKRPPTSTAGAPRLTGRSRTRLTTRGRTATMTKQKKRMFGRAKKLGDNSSISASYYGRSWANATLRNIMKQVAAKQVQSQNSSTNVASTTGQQNMITLRCLTRNQLNNMTITANGGGVFPDNPIKLFIENVKMRTVFKNQSNSVGRVSIYDIDSTKTPPGTGFDDPIEAWAKGMADLSQVDYHKTVGATPYISPEFRQYFRVNKVTQVYLEPGQQHEHNVYFKVNRVCDSTRWSNWSADSIGWLTKHVMIVFHGTLGHESATPGNVSYIPIRMDVANHLDIKYGVVEKKQTTYAFTNNLPASVVNFDFMGENQDADIDPIDA